MKKINFTEVTNQQLVDVRSQYDFQAGHLANSLNLNLGNFKKYATYYLKLNQPVVFIVNDAEQENLEELSNLAKELNFTKADGYLAIDDVLKEELQTLATIPAEDFLNQKDDYILLDVRRPDEITRPAPEKNLVNLPFEELVTDYSTLDKDKIVYTLCGSGNRSTAAASYLLTKGFKPIVIDGGMKAVQTLENK